MAAMVEEAPKRKHGLLRGLLIHVLTTAVFFGAARHSISQYAPDIPWPSIPWPDVPENEVAAGLFGATFLTLAIIMSPPGLLRLGTFAFATAGFCLAIPWFSFEGEYLWTLDSKVLFELVLIAAFVGGGFLLLGRTVGSAIVATGCAAMILIVVAVNLYELGPSTAYASNRELYEVAFGIYVLLASGAIAALVSGIWAANLWLHRPRPPETFPRFTEPFPRL
jgi:hypothetical protein